MFTNSSNRFLSIKIFKYLFLLDNIENKYNPNSDK